jgi:uncharacterized protein (TIGR02145 family)
MGIIIIILLVIVIYFLPTLIGMNKKNVGAIFALNLLLGWSFIGWVVSMVWACTKDRNDNPPVVVINQNETRKEYTPTVIKGEIKEPSLDKSILLNQLDQIHGLKEKGVLGESEYEKERRDILIKLGHIQTQGISARVITIEPDSAFGLTKKVESTAQTQTTPIPKRNYNNSNGKIWALVIMILLIGGGILFFYLHNNNTDNKSDEKGKYIPNVIVTLGTQVWTTSNLDVTTFRNGDSIPEAESNKEWENAKNEGTPAWCYYLGDASYGNKYGKLYNWYAVNDTRGLAPQGQHIPSDAEWIALIDYLGGYNKAGKKMKSVSGWESSGNGNNNSGFSVLPGGGRLGTGPFDDLGFGGYFWSSNEYDNGTAMTCGLISSNSKVDLVHDDKGCGYSVRCIQN